MDSKAIDIFVSYAREDLDHVGMLGRALSLHGYDVWYDRDVVAGHDYATVIESALQRAKVIIVVWSERAVKSKWVRAEAERGFSRDCLLPVTIEACAVPLPFNTLNTIDLSEWQGADDDRRWRTVLAAVARMAPKPIHTEPQPLISHAATAPSPRHAPAAPHQVVEVPRRALLIGGAVAGAALLGGAIMFASNNVGGGPASGTSLAQEPPIVPPSVAPRGESVIRTGGKVVYGVGTAMFKGVRTIFAAVDETLMAFEHGSGRLLDQYRPVDNTALVIQTIDLNENERKLILSAGSRAELIDLSGDQLGAAPRSFSYGELPVKHVAISTDGALVAIANSTAEGGRVVFWSAADANARIQNIQTAESINGIAFVRATAIAVAHDSGVSVYNIADPSALSRFGGHNDIVNSVAVEQSGQRAISGDSNHRVCLWSVDGGGKIADLSFGGMGHGRIEKVAFSGDGSHCAACDASGRVFVWKTDSINQSTDPASQASACGAGKTISLSYAGDITSAGGVCGDVLVTAA